MAALLIRIASLALPAKLRKKYLRAWLAELQDAKADGEGWAFAYDLLVNMGSLKEAAQGKDILYRNKSKTPLWLSMGSLGTAILATVVAVSFWGDLKTPIGNPVNNTANTGSAASPAIVSSEESVEASARAFNDSQKSDALVAIDSLADGYVTAEEAQLEPEAIVAFTESEPADVQASQEVTEAVAGIVEVDNAVEVDSGLEVDSARARSEVVVEETVDPEESVEVPVVDSAPSVEVEGVSLGEARAAITPPTTSTATLITPLTESEAPSVGAFAEATTTVETSESTEFSDAIGSIDSIAANPIEAIISEVEEVITPIPAPAIVAGAAGPTGPAAPTAVTTPTAVTAPTATGPITAPALAAPAPSAPEVEALVIQPVAPVGIPGQAGIPNIPGINPNAEVTVQAEVDTFAVPQVIAPQVIAPVTAQAEDQDNRVDSMVSNSLSETQATNMAENISGFQEPDNSTTTIVIREAEVERPIIAEDLAALQEKLALGAQANSLEDVALGLTDTGLTDTGVIDAGVTDASDDIASDALEVSADNASDASVRSQLELAQEAMQASNAAQQLQRATQGATGQGNTSNTQLGQLGQIGVTEPTDARQGVVIPVLPASPPASPLASPPPPVAAGPIGAPGRSGDANDTLTNASSAVPTNPNSGAAERNPLEDISDEATQLLIDEFLENGDLSFENSAELIAKLGDALGLGEEEVRELLRALVGRLEP